MQELSIFAPYISTHDNLPLVTEDKILGEYKKIVNVLMSIYAELLP